MVFCSSYKSLYCCILCSVCIGTDCKSCVFTLFINLKTTYTNPAHTPMHIKNVIGEWVLTEANVRLLQTEKYHSCFCKVPSLCYHPSARNHCQRKYKEGMSNSDCWTIILASAELYNAFLDKTRTVDFVPISYIGIALGRKLLMISNQTLFQCSYGLMDAVLRQTWGIWTYSCSFCSWELDCKLVHCMETRVCAEL